MCYVIDRLERIACHLPGVFILLPSTAPGNYGNVFSATVINEVTGSGALSDLRGSGYKLVL